MVITQMYGCNASLAKTRLIMVCFVLLGADLDVVGSCGVKRIFSRVQGIVRDRSIDLSWFFT